MTTTYATRTYDARIYHSDVDFVVGPWLGVIHAINGIAPGTFGSPTVESFDLIGGGTRYVEHYPGFDVVFLDAHPSEPLRRTVSIVALTEEAAELLAQVD